MAGRFARSFWTGVAIVGMLGAPVAADHSPHLDVVCPTGTADIVIDPGHGGSDPGAYRMGPELFERDVVLDISRTIAHILEDETGLTVALTREDNRTELGNSERGEIANVCRAQVFVEIHLNAASDPDINRAQSFWGEKEKDLAFSVVMNNSLASLGIPVAAVDRFDNGGLLRARMPAVLVEAAFLTNDQEANRLRGGERRQAIATAIADGVVTWLAISGDLAASEGSAQR